MFVNIELEKNLDRIATDAGQSGYSRQITLWKDEFAANESFNKNALSEKNMSELRAVALNSESRKRSYDGVIELRKELNQRLTDFLIFSGACDSLIVENEQVLQSWKAE